MSDYLWFEGIPFPIIKYEKEIIEKSCDKFVFRDEDIVILAYPKSGTNWMKEIVCLIQNKGDPSWIQSVPIWDRSPSIESQRGYQLLINKEGPRLISSHLPFHFFPKSFFSSKAKTTSEYQNVKYHTVILGSYMKECEISTRAFRNYTNRAKHLEMHNQLLCFSQGKSISPTLCISELPIIYVIRNPRDVLVSGYFFWRKTKYVRIPESLTTYFEWFIKGNVAYGSWFEHTRAWLSMRKRDNFLLLSYEDIKKDTKSTIKKICDFLGKKLEPNELDMVLKYSSFQAMKENKMSNFSLTTKYGAPNRLDLLRKGMTGDWKNHFTVAQAEAFDKVFQEKMAGFPPGLFPWE